MKHLLILVIAAVLANVALAEDAADLEFIINRYQEPAGATTLKLVCKASAVTCSLTRMKSKQRTDRSVERDRISTSLSKLKSLIPSGAATPTPETVTLRWTLRSGQKKWSGAQGVGGKPQNVRLQLEVLQFEQQLQQPLAE